MPQPTADADVEIIAKLPSEEGHHGYVKYRRISNGQEWEVRGNCDYRGDCIIGATIKDKQGNDVTIQDHHHIEELKTALGVNRLISEMDVPVTVGFEGCCPLIITETNPGS